MQLLKYICLFSLINLAFTPLAAFATVILQYHNVSEHTPPSTSISPQMFEKHIRYLQENNFNLISLPALADALKAGKSLPEKSVAITFDDGYVNILENAHPLLHKHKIPYTVFINPAFVGERGDHLSLAQIKAMQAQGVTFANHSWQHQHLVRHQKQESQQAWLARVLDDVDKTERWLEQNLGQSHKLFAYPYGEYTQTLAQQLTQKGYLSFGQHSGAVGPTSPRGFLPRFPAAGVYANLNSLSTKLLSLPFTLPPQNFAEPIYTARIPTLTLKLSIQDFKPEWVSCFVSGQGRTEVSWPEQDSFSVTAQSPLATGRSRYNCTAPSQTHPGRFYWYSQPWITPKSDGSWYQEK